VFAAWVLATAVPRYPGLVRRGSVPARTLGGATSFHLQGSKWDVFDQLVEVIRNQSAPGDRILDLSASPLFYVAADRRGPGYADLVMPGTFLSDGEEIALLERLQASPPALVIVSKRPFDRDVDRGLLGTAPRIRTWVLERYQTLAEGKNYLIFALPEGSGDAERRPLGDVVR
jgi:hypothetical protein